jgi:DNA-binding transcriptional ArsR family regulator
MIAAVPRKTKNTAREIFVLDELTQIKALADPLRQRLLAAFASATQTTKQVADCLGESPTKLYHHVDMLAEAGLLQLVETRQKRGTTERYYRAAARHFSVDRNIFRNLPAARSGRRATTPDAVFNAAFATALANIRKAVRKKLIASDKSQHKAALLQGQFRGTEKQAAALRMKIQKLIERQNASKSRRVSKDGTIADYAVLLAIYPTAHGR